MVRKEHKYSIVPPSSYFQEDWPDNPNFTQGFRGALSVAGWTSGNIDGTPSDNGNEGYVQQSFLGASIRSFSVNAGFGDSSSTMGIELVNDEFHTSDGTDFGLGDDVYHSGVHDHFMPPVVGSPVFFKFGKNYASVEQAFRKDFDQIYSTPTSIDRNGNIIPENKIDTLEMPAEPFPIVEKDLPIEKHEEGYYLLSKDTQAGIAKWIDKSVLLDPETKWRGFAHFTFGGILQSYTENRGSNGNPLYSVKLTDPREILTNTQLILNNYQGTTFNNKNLYNIYGFLEYDPSDQLTKQFDENSDDKQVLTKSVDPLGVVSYFGTDKYILNSGVEVEIISGKKEQKVKVSGEFPVTGQGFSRRGDNGIPWYRVDQALKSLFAYDSELPHEYQEAGFGGVVDFRGYNYVVDWGGIPTEEIPLTYYLDFDKMSMMELAQELCDVLSRDLFVSLLPVIDHPSCSHLFKKNQEVLAKAQELPPDSPERDLILGSGLVNGIIRIDSIDKKDPPTYGAVKKYLDDLEANDIFVESRDVGFEVSNVVTDKFIVGAQEVDMHYFNNLRDRDNYLERLKDEGDAQGKQRLEQIGHDKWTLETNQNQQILPFYGFIGDNAVSIPRGFGSYQQILLDARGLDAHGVGAYYVATEMELRAAAVSYEQWSKFLRTYNEIYIQELSENQYFFQSLTTKMTEVVAGINDQIDEDSPVKEQLDKLTAGGRNFGVGVPRSVWNSGKSNEEGKSTRQVEETDEDGNPVLDPNTGEPNTTDVEIKTGGPFEGKMGKDGYPASPCNPPYGYPLYYKRAEKIGIPEAGLTKIAGAFQTVVSNIESLQNMETSDKQRFSYAKTMADNSERRLRELINQKRMQMLKGVASERNNAIEKDIGILGERINQIRANLVKEREDIEKLRDSRRVQIIQLKDAYKNAAGIIKNFSKYQRQNLNNAKKVYNFVKKVADDNLGKKFLVKIPRACNVNWSSRIKKKDDKAWDVIRGPFGFKPQPISAIPGYTGGSGWKDRLKDFKRVAKKAEREGPTPTALPSSIWPTKSNIHWHYLDVDAMGQAAAELGSKELVHYGSGYTFGALKCNYNPMSEAWEFNYRPEPQGGFFNYALYDKNLKAAEAKLSGVPETKLPKATRNILAPKLLDKLVTNSNRIHCYARYDHSQHLDFGSINPADMEQQSIDKDGNIIPDVMETLPNNDPDKKNALNSIEARLNDDELIERQGKSVAFVKCEVDDRFYMSPKTLRGDATVWAEDFTVGLAEQPYEVIYVDGSGDYEGCRVPKEVKRRPTPVFGVKDGGLISPEGAESGVLVEDAHKVPWDDFRREYSETFKEWIITTEEKDLDDKHVYALITVPGRITPTIDKRYVDGPLRGINAVSIANALTEDVVKIKEFALPGEENDEDPIVDCSKLPSGVDFTWEDLTRAVQAQKEMAQLISLSSNGSTSKLSFSSPSPIYPDIVAIPLLSEERCYGPWVSSALDGKMVGGPDEKFSEIGGKIEFEKDENLAPWSYAGYQLMDQSAKMKTKFSNSLLLFSERGSFSYASAPIDVSLAKALKEKGPLVTSISVNVSNQSIMTSVKLDLYTSQFGKLQKQKEIAIAQISRERQKTIDQNNSLIRRGLGKGAANMNLQGSLLEKGGQRLLDAARDSSNLMTSLEKGEEQKPSMITVSATPTDTILENKDGTSETLKSGDREATMQTDSQLEEMKSLFRTQQELDDVTQKTAGIHLSDLFKGISDDPLDPNFASRQANNITKKNRRTLG